MLHCCTQNLVQNLKGSIKYYLSLKCIKNYKISYIVIYINAMFFSQFFEFAINK